MPTDAHTPTRRPVPENLFGGRLNGSYLLTLSVVATEDLAPHVRSVTFASTDLVGFEYVPGQDLMIEFPMADGSLRRRYTIRRADPQAGTATLEFELHDGRGVANEWARGATVGDRLESIGPRGNIGLRADAEHHLFVADDSAMPPVFAMLEALPAEASATAVLVTPHGPESRPGPRQPAASVVWTDEASLSEVLPPLDGGVAYVFGERSMVKDARQTLGAAAGADRIAAKAYWRRDQPNAGHGEPRHD